MSDITHAMADMLADSATSFVDRNYDFARRNRRLTENLGPASPLWREFAELGWLGCLVPERAGGLGASATEMTALMQVFGRALLVEPVLSSAVFATKLLDAAGRPVADDLLARLAAGDCQVAVAYAEDGAQAGFGDVATTVIAGADGELVLRGRKAMVLGAPTASHLVVLARGAVPDGPELFLVDAAAAGIDVTRYRTIDGHEAADIVFSDVRVTADACLGPATGALSPALDWAAMAACAQLVGAIDEVVRISVDYARTRRQFGQPIGSFQSIRHLLAEMATQALLARAMLVRGTEALHHDDVVRRECAVSAARNAIARAADFVTANGIQIHGGIGMTDECIVGHYYKRSLVLSELFGNAAFHRDRFARHTRAIGDDTLISQSGHSDAV